MNNVFIYEGDFISLLNIILYLLRNNLTPSNIKLEDYSPSLFEHTIKLDVSKDEKIVDNIINSFGLEALQAMYLVFLSSEENKELIIYYFFRNALKIKQKILYYRNLKCVSEVLRISSYVRNEAHKMKGFLRFKELENNILYAEAEPTNDILFLLSCHFAKRLKNEFWIIKDKKRKIISVYDKKQFIILNENEFQLMNLSESNEEQKFEDLWKTFYKTIGIKERKNDQCRKNFMPKKYWKYITEVSYEL